MRGAAYGTAALRGSALAMLVLALVMRLLVPAGWMPTSTDRGGWLIVPCSGTGPMAMTMPSAASGATDGKHRMPDHDKAPADHPCGFASFATAMHPALLADVTPAMRVAPAPMPSRDAVIGVGRGLAAPPPPSTGPPLA